MGVFDKFLDIMKLNEDDYDDQYDEYDEGGFYDDDEYEDCLLYTSDAADD